jgi:hypothetical protein
MIRGFSTSRFADQPTRIEPLGNGSIVTSNTLGKMKEIILASVRNYYVRLWAERIVGFAQDDYEKSEVIFNFIVNNCRYLNDPVGIELLKTPIISLQLIEIGGSPAIDCDDAAILIGSLVMSIGIPYALRAVSFNDDFSHVYGLVQTKEKGWVPVDFVVGKKGGRIGEEPPGITKIKDEVV